MNEDETSTEFRTRGSGQTARSRRRAALEMVGRYEHALKRTARRYSLDAEDVEDAYQRALEIVLTKAPTADPGELIRWTQTVIKHEAMAVRRQRERLLGIAPLPGQTTPGEDPVALLPARGDGPDAQVERREDVARTREALQALKPAELRALTLLAEGYSYLEIAEITGFSLTKINRCLAEGRERFRSILHSSESGDRCRELRPLISAFCDGETGPKDSATVREHLRACAHCRATMRTYRTAPRLAAALIPALPLQPSLLARMRELVSGFGSHAVAVKQLGLYAAVGGSVAVGVASGVLPNPLATGSDRVTPGGIERRATQAPDEEPKAQERVKRHIAKAGRMRHHRAQAREKQGAEAGPAEALEYEPPSEAPPPEAVTSPVPSPEPGPSGGSAAGEFGP